MAADVLLAGGVVAYPTETFYGLAVDIRNEAAIRRLLSIKKRSATRPVLILIVCVEFLDQYVGSIPPIARRLMDAFWPGDLTLVFEAGQRVSPLLTGGSGKIGIRLSSHPVATALARAIEGSISGTSANLSGQPACSNAHEVLNCLGSGIDLILDAGETAGRVGSTVLDVTVQPLRVLREGVITREHLKTRSFSVV
ncbi:MAG: threonylcarbamoyl-AMP synthase [Deltaproteobacteria bacterium]|nr:threonylcarbamoyl-AMP synthase [Deltaproteobacteria bacterium]